MKGEITKNNFRGWKKQSSTYMQMLENDKNNKDTVAVNTGKREKFQKTILQSQNIFLPTSPQTFQYLFKVNELQLKKVLY